MNKITKRLVSIGASLVLALNIASFAPFFVQSASAARTTNSATLNGGTSVTVVAGASITAAVNATISNGDDWHGTSWLISTTAPGSMSCANTADHDTDGTYNEQFSITAPNTPGTYNAYFRISGSGSCNGQSGSLITLFNAVTVTAPDLTALKTNNVNGSVVVNTPFTWTIRVANSGNATANFADGQEILVDQRATGTYGTATVNTSGTTGNFVCSTSGSGGRDLSCKASGAATVPAGAYIEVSFTATPSATGSIANPRNGATCAADNGKVVTESNENNNACSDTVNVVPVPPVTNPVLAQSCGLDIGLVIDSSGSIDATELSQMKTAYTAFLNAFLPGTPTQFSVTDFDTTASVVQGFTNNLANLTTAVNTPTSGGFTNWEDGLLKASSTFDPRPSVPNLIFFASDGNPNTVFGGSGGAASESAAVDAAKTVANTIKNSGTRIVALGIGSDLNVDNLKQVSGPTVGTTLNADVITSNFATLANDLKAFATELCGGTITTTKIVDQDGNVNTTNDQTVASGWSFDVDGTPSNPAATSTDANGKTPAVDVDPGTYSVNETVKSGYVVIAASCNGATNNGTKSDNSVSGIVVNANDIVSCTFINSPAPTLTLVKTVINDNGGDKKASDFQAKIDGNSVEWSTAVTLTPGQHTASEVGLSTYTASDWGGDCAADGTITLAAGQNKTCTITNDDNAPILKLIKILEDKYNSTYTSADWLVRATGETTIYGNGSATSDTTFVAGKYELSESGPTQGIDMGSWTCDNVDVYKNIIQMSLDQTTECTITNTVQPATLVVKKVVINDNSGDSEATDFSFSLNNNKDTYWFVQDGDDSHGIKTLTLPRGTYTVTEDQENSDEYKTSYSDDCYQVYITNGQTKTCIITNDDVPHPSISVQKFGPNSAHEGDTVNYMFVVTNTGDVALNSIQVNDNIAGNAQYQYGDDGDGLLETDEEWVYFVGYTIPQNQNEDVVNTVTVCGQAYEQNYDAYTKVSEWEEYGCSEDGECYEGYVCNTDTHTLDVLHPAISVDKTGPASAVAGSTVTYTFTVTNTGDVALNGLTVVDSITGNGTYVSGDTNEDDMLDVDETWVYTATYTIPADQIAPVQNKVTVCGFDSQIFLDSQLSRSVDSQELVIDNRVKVCNTDSHTLLIPQVLSATTTEPTPLVNTGSSSLGIYSAIAMLNIAVAVMLYAVNKKQWAKKSL